MFGFGDLNGVYIDKGPEYIKPIYNLVWYNKIDEITDGDRFIRKKEEDNGIGINNILAYGGKIDSIPKLYDLGVRVIRINNNIDINEKNIIALNKKRIAIDCVGVSNDDFYRIMNTTKIPVLTTIGNSKSINNNNNNLTDEKLIFMKKTNSLVGLNLDNRYLTGHIGKDNSFEYIFKHIDYIINLIGYKNLCITSNLGTDNQNPWELKSIEQIYILRNYLLEYYGIHVVERIIYKNIHNFLKKTIF